MRFVRTFVVGVVLVAIAAACSSSKASHPATTGGSTFTLNGGNLLPPGQAPSTPDTGPGPHLYNADGQADHWHAALGVNVCGTWEPGPIWPHNANGELTRADQPNVYAGLHTHQLMDGSSDGLIHMEPAARDEAGRNATLGRYMEYGGWRVSATAMQLWPPIKTYGFDSHGQPIVSHLGVKPIAMRNGQRCGAQSAVVRWATGTYVPGRATTLTEQHGDPSRLKLTDNQVIGLYFVPASTSLASLGAVPSISNLPIAQG